MFEKVNSSHPDKVADRIAGAIVDLCYKQQENPKVAVEVLLGHDKCHIINETSCKLSKREVFKLVNRIVGNKIKTDYLEIKQDIHLADNQKEQIRCGDNGIFKGVPITEEQKRLTSIAKIIYKNFPYDGKYIINGNELIICQSNARNELIKNLFPLTMAKHMTVNPLGEWTGGINVDSGATNRKLGSDMGDAVTGGGIQGKDLSKADVSVNIYAHLKAQETGKAVRCYCAIGDLFVSVKIGDSKSVSVPFEEIAKIAKDYIDKLGGFEKFAEWGLIR